MAESAAAVGVLGGTFDPVHSAHLRLAREARMVAGLAEVRLVPAGIPPHRAPPLASPGDRLAMVELAVAGQSGLRADDCEIAMTSPSYTVATLERMRERLGPATPLVLILGADAFLGLMSWFHWRELFSLAHLLVATRPGHDLREEHMPTALAAEFAARAGTTRDLHAAPAGRIVAFLMTPLEISASAIRHSLSSGELPQGWLPEPVLDYIFRHHLYQAPH